MDGRGDAYIGIAAAESDMEVGIDEARESIDLGADLEG